MSFSFNRLLSTRLSSMLQRTPLQVRSYTKFDLHGYSSIPHNKKKHVPTSGKYPKGFRVGSASVGIKPGDTGHPDLVLVASDEPSCGAAVFTKNEFPAASITVSKDVLQRTKGQGIQGVIVNAWCANLFTGKPGLDDSRAMSIEAAKQLSAEGDSSVMVMHTGICSQRLPMNNILQGIPTIYQDMGNSHGHWLEAALGTTTTDTFPKLASRTFNLPSSPGTIYSIAGITKGAGMIHPNMATTLGVLCTDAPVTPAALQQALSIAVDKSYNCISVDGDTSTNDMVAILANGAAGGTPVDFAKSSSSQSAEFVSFQRTLIEFMADMAKLVVRDGEGASKFITIRVRGAPSYPAGKHIASVIARSVLFKAGVYGKDPNWAGVLAALGYSLAGTEFAGKGIIVPELTSVSYVPVDGGQWLKFMDKGVPVKFDEARAKEMMEQEDVEIVLDLRDDGQEHEEAVYWTCDLTHEFVTINGDFRA